MRLTGWTRSRMGERSTPVHLYIYICTSWTLTRHPQSSNSFPGTPLELDRRDRFQDVRRTFGTDGRFVVMPPSCTLIAIDPASALGRPKDLLAGHRARGFGSDQISIVGNVGRFSRACSCCRRAGRRDIAGRSRSREGGVLPRIRIIWPREVLTNDRRPALRSLPPSGFRS